MKTGIYQDIPIEDYHSGPGLSNSSLSRILRSPRNFWYHSSMNKHREPEANEKSATLIFGDAQHRRVLEPEKWDSEFAVMPDMDRRTKAGKEAYEAFCLRYPPDVWTHITADQKRISDAMYAALADHWIEYNGHHIRTINLFQGGKAEQTIYWTDPTTGLLCRCRPDYMNDLMAVDYKTATSSDMRSFRQSMAGYGYYRQAAFYLDGMKAVGNGGHRNFVFVVQEKAPPYEVAVYAISDSAIEVGRRDYQRAMELYQKNLAAYGMTPWPMASHQIQEIDLPQYMYWEGNM